MKDLIRMVDAITRLMFVVTLLLVVMGTFYR